LRRRNFCHASAVMGLARLAPPAASNVPGRHVNRSGHYCGRAGWLLVLLGYLFYFYKLPLADPTVADRLAGAGLFAHLVQPVLLLAALLTEGLSITALLADHAPDA
jgi:hypothetical protein